MNLNACTGKTLKPWPILVDHYTSKVVHFLSLQEKFNLAFEQMVFFDDEMRNIHEVAALGVKAVFVEEGKLVTV